MQLPPEKKKKGSALAAYKVVDTPNVAQMASNLMSIIAIEIDRLYVKARSGAPLSLPEVKTLSAYAETLTRLNKESREQAKDIDLSELSTEELIKLLRKQPNMPAIK